MPKAFFDQPSPARLAGGYPAACGDPQMIEALRAQHLRVVFQPQYALPGLQLRGFEALVRLSIGENLQWIEPDRFLPLAHAAGLMGELTLYMVESACRVLRNWREGGLISVFIAVNIEADDLADILFAPRICRLMAEYGIGPGELELELVERHALQPGDTTKTNIEMLRAAGVRLAMDDFGTGHSGLSQLRELPFDIVKIDKSFLQRVPHDASACTLMTSIIDMCLALNKEVVVEGVESEAQLCWLARLHRVRLQGNKLSHPLSEALAREQIPSVPRIT